MAELGVEEDIAFIRRTVEGGRVYARGRSADMLVWGLFVAAGYLNTYAWLRHWPSVQPNLAWLFAIVLPALYSFRRLAARVLGRPPAARSPMATALSMLWLGCGISMVMLAIAANLSHGVHENWYDAAIAGILGIAFFAGSFLCNLAWMRYVAFAWWAGELALYGLRDDVTAPLVGAVMMLFFLAGPGLVLLTSGRAPA
jgi:hypothetical protein